MDVKRRVEDGCDKWGFETSRERMIYIAELRKRDAR